MSAVRGELPELRWPPEGLLPAVAQDLVTGRILMLAWQDREALARTLETGYAHFFSRSRQRLWLKGESSGNRLRVHEVRTDCDRDAILLLVEPEGPTCHTGKPSCFHHHLAPGAPREEADNPQPLGGILGRLSRVIAERARSGDPQRSWTRRLLEDSELAAAKVREEAEELVAAVASESAERVAAETADLFYHALVLVHTRGVDFKQVATVLAGRFGIGGITEKEGRRARMEPTDAAEASNGGGGAPGG